MNDKTETATFAAGCFWGVEAAFRKVEGVISTSVGYIGGAAENPTYEQVCTGATGHAEVVQVVFDPGRVGYGDLLWVFWKIHDPTTRDRQGPDIGTQYRSAVFFHSPEQEQAACALVADVEKSVTHGIPVVTEIVAAPQYWPAEDCHQQYFEKQGGHRRRGFDRFSHGQSKGIQYR